MGWKLGKIQQAALEVVKEEKHNNLLGRELTRTLGPTILTNHGATLMAESANKRLDVYEFQDKKVEKINTSLLLKHADSPIAEVRRLVARLLPENMLNRFMNDKNRGVRLAAAKRLPIHLVEVMVKSYPNDEQLEFVLQSKLSEANEEYLDIYGDIRVGEAEKSVEHPGLTDEWYETQARKIVNTYGGFIEHPWEEKAVMQLTNGLKSQGIEVDSEKLLDLVYGLLSSRAEDALEESIFKKMVKQLNEQADMEMPILPEELSKVEDLLEARLSPSEFVSRFESVFSVVKSSTANPGSKIGINENFSRVKCPATAIIPGSFIGSKEELALDTYVKHWNAIQKLKGSPYCLAWNPLHGNKVNFTLGVR